ncbi:hypothetical protein [Streptomyces ficellus]|uniref:PASTA domain-containing protein n=1 Tax=Streptomyces ficellus TaxID=1977088 RepID=A0A6I6FGU1_9ACTN|nr:hypothetical protein [Streptomyces ficellus]QGV77739.1 hypothetical protein EIZ62_05365 [Streptomyces ficellus]
MKRAATVTAGMTLALTTMGALGGAAAVAAAAAPPLPDFTGKGLMTVFSTMDQRTRVDVRDASGYGRTVLWPANWKVCSQYPAAGADLDGRPLSVAVMKTDEKCPSSPSESPSESPSKSTATEPARAPAPLVKRPAKGLAKSPADSPADGPDDRPAPHRAAGPAGHPAPHPDGAFADRPRTDR